MERLKLAYHRWFFEPLICLLRCFFQPAGFSKDFEGLQLSARMRLMLKLWLPMFVCSYLLVLCGRITIYLFAPEQYAAYFIGAGPAINWPLFLFDGAWAAALSCLLGGLFGGLFSVAFGIAFGMMGGVADGIIVIITNDTLVMICFGLACGVMFGLTFNSIGAVKRNGWVKTTIGIAVGVALGIIVGAASGIFAGFWSGVIVGIVGRRLGIKDVPTGQGIEGNITGLVVGCFVGCFIIALVGLLVKGSTRKNGEVIDIGTRIGIAVAGVFGAAIGILTGNLGMWLGSSAMMRSLLTGGFDGMVVGVAFLLGYIPSYYRLPLYPLDALSMLKVYLASQRQPPRVFYNLHHCALCCDENVFLPLPYARQMLLLAATQDVEETLEEIDFLVHERPQQRGAAQAAVIEIALSDLQGRESLHEISHAYQRLAVTLPQEIRLIDPRVARLFRHLEDASRDAASYYSRVRPQAQLEALESMLANLKKIYPDTAFREMMLNRRLEEVVQKWRAIARHEQERISHVTEQVGRIDNPYAPGLVLELHDPLFVGRTDLAQQLGEALRRGRRPTFFLTGERRMGKSSILKQLPDLLGSHYLPIFYDLQSTGVASSIAALLAAIAEGIYDLLTVKGMPLRKLEYEQLRADQRENEAVVYHRFGRWLKDVERILDREDRTLLLAFDEFEKLEDAGQKGHIDLNLLLDWFRSVIQNRPRLALLFSGVKTVSDMRSNWAGYFVNVETLKVSFLHRDEARQLIIHPVARFPGERVFTHEVVEGLIRVTGGHPFLIQALCSIIITNLNYRSRQQALLQDVAQAVDEVFKKWGEYFRDLWERTDQAQRNCLFALHALERASLACVQQRSGLDDVATHRALQQLLKRDLVCYENDEYWLAAPIFANWVERSK